MKINKQILNSDFLGATAGSLCLVHCLATPFIFIAKACSETCCTDAPIWWQAIDFMFIAISFLAIFFVSKTTKIRWMPIALWSAWALLFGVIMTETFEMGWLPHSFIYFPAVSIIVLHFYNLKYWKC